MKFITFSAPDGSVRGVPLSVVIANCAEDRVGGGASDVHRAEIDADHDVAIDWAVSHMDFDTELLPHAKLLAKPAQPDLRSAWLANTKIVLDV
jgi:hypothetical protein